MGIEVQKELKIPTALELEIASIRKIGQFAREGLEGIVGILTKRLALYDNNWFEDNTQLYGALRNNFYHTPATNNIHVNTFHYLNNSHEHVTGFVQVNGSNMSLPISIEGFYHWIRYYLYKHNCPEGNVRSRICPCESCIKGYHWYTMLGSPKSKILHSVFTETRLSNLLNRVYLNYNHSCYGLTVMIRIVNLSQQRCPCCSYSGYTDNMMTECSNCLEELCRCSCVCIHCHADRGTCSCPDPFRGEFWSDDENYGPEDYAEDEDIDF